MRQFVWIVSWGFGACVLAGLVLRWWTGDHLFLSRFTAYFMPWLLIGLIPALMWAGLTHHWRLVFVVGACVILIFAAYVPLFLPRPVTPEPGAGEIRVLSFNTWSKNTHVARMAQVILQKQPDILLLQEIEPRIFEKLIEQLRGLYPEGSISFSYDPRLLQAVVSRYPIESSVSLKKKGQAQKVVLLSPVGPVTVFNVHPLRRGGWLRRYRKLAALMEEDILPDAGPVILGGDFNITDQSQTFKMINRRLHNAHLEAGYGFGFTYPSLSLRLFGILPVPPLVRIDHIFFNDRFVALQAGTLKDSGGSDHFPVAAVLAPK
ncbi:MAG: endonuclease/exonuclease/phosphatase family protein [Deltaproteobacteria bacterium]|nr:endonuclease/exonuclease/phosphatase family protein [Deltaproteobacteria bacterium]